MTKWILIITFLEKVFEIEHLGIWNDIDITKLQNVDNIAALKNLDDQCHTNEELTTKIVSQEGAISEANRQKSLK